MVVVVGAEAARLSYSHCPVLLNLETHRLLLLLLRSAPIRTPPGDKSPPSTPLSGDQK